MSDLAIRSVPCWKCGKVAYAEPDGSCAAPQCFQHRCEWGQPNPLLVQLSDPAFAQLPALVEINRKLDALDALMKILIEEVRRKP